MEGLSVGLVTRLIVGAIFIVSAISKLQSRSDLERALVDIHVPLGVIPGLAVAIALGELLLGGALLADTQSSFTALAAAAVLVIFSAAYFATRSRGTGGCGCFGELIPESSPTATTARNVVLIALALCSTIAPGAFPETLVGWFATASVSAAGVLSLILISYVHYLGGPTRRRLRSRQP